VVSSYTPTISILLEKVKASNVEHPTSSKVLLVSHKISPGGHPTLGSRREIDSVTRIIGADSCLHLDGSSATVSRVKQETEKCNWVHLSCGGNRDRGLVLHDGLLGLLDTMQLRTPQCKLAFLSASETAAGDESLPDEAVHLAAGMLAAGCQGVVGTLWAISEKYAAEVAGSFYEYLAAEKKKDGDGGSPKNLRLDSSRAVYALHHAVQRLRKETGDTEDGLLAWVPYAHFGL